jgi:hypothetical protein
MGPGFHSVRFARRRWLAVLAVGALLVAGCGAFRREPLDVPPGHKVVLGEIVVSGFPNPHLVFDLAREDGAFQLELPVDATRSPFVITVPPGHYVIKNVRVNEQGRTGPESTNFRVSITFDVGDPAVYVGTLRIERVNFLRQLRVTVKDEYESAVPAMRSRFPGLPAEITRSLAYGT